MTITRSDPTTTWGIGGAVWPQVDLLPPSVREGRRLKATKRNLLFTVLGVLVVVTLACVAAFANSVAAGAELATVQDQTAVLLAEQTKYAEVPRVLSQISKAEAARQAGMSTEIAWKPYLEALRAVTPAGVSYDTISVVTATPMSAAPASTDALAPTSIGQIAFTARSATLPDMSAWMDAIATVPGLDNPWFTSASLTDDAGKAYYQVSASVSILDSAFAHRFVAKGGK